jgi:membrane protease YdiL (CAAX protease family)
MKRLWSWLTRQRVPVAAMRIDRPRGEAALWSGYAIGYAVLALLVGLLIRVVPLPLLGSVKFTDDLWYLLVFKLGALLAVPLLILWRQGYGPRDLLPAWRWRVITVFTLAVVAALAVVPNLGHLAAIQQAIDRQDGAMIAVIGAATAVPLLCAALPEEIVFRGLLQTRLEAVLGRLPALVLAALLFTLWHLPTRYLLSSGVEGAAGDLGSVLLGTGLPVFIVGLVFGWAWDRWRSLPHLVLAHWAVDLLPSLSSYLGIAY